LEDHKEFKLSFAKNTLNFYTRKDKCRLFEKEILNVLVEKKYFIDFQIDKIFQPKLKKVVFTL
jgi:hypothetical protein